jgi:hypothetical protein
MPQKKGRQPIRPLVMEDEGGTGTRDSFLSSFFKRGEELTQDLVRETELLRARVAELEAEAAVVREQVAHDTMLDAALKRVAALEHERDVLVRQASEAAAVSTRSAALCSAVENDLANLANLYVAADQLHSTLDLDRVLQHTTELLEQFVGSREHAIYYVDDDGTTLVPVAAHGILLAAVPRLSTRPSAEPPPWARAIEQAFLTGTQVFDPDILACGTDRPVACVPLKLDGTCVGVITVYRLLDQKRTLTANDRELFRMLGAHAATAITGARLWRRAGNALPSH